MEGERPDLFAVALEPLHARVGEVVTAAGASPAVTEALIGLMRCVEVAAVVGLIAAGGVLLRRDPIASQADGGITQPRVRLLAAIGAAGLFAWIVCRPGQDIFSLFGRLDHLALCGLAGYGLSTLSPRWRKWTLSPLSLVLIGQHTGWLPLGLVLAGGILGLALLKFPHTQTTRRTAFAQASVLIAMFLICWRIRVADLGLGIVMHGLFAFVLLRHISFVVEARRGRAADIGSYLFYMLFYPSFLGASEIYSEFSERNLSGPVAVPYPGVARSIIFGRLQIWAALQIPSSIEAALRIQGTLALWSYVLVMFVRSALFLMGLWRIIEACARLYGVQLRPNFPHILWCENPSQFWHSWRATMTNWLIHYVYIPLGGNRRRQARNIAAAFAVSTLWHWMGIPFVALHVSARDFVPIGAWGTINALAVVSYAYAHRADWRVLPDRTPPLIRRGAKMFLTACLGTITVTFLSTSPDLLEHFTAFVRTLVGLNAR